MADFNLLYKEGGLDAIIPYAFGMSGKGYAFLCDRLKQGEPFWLPYSNSTNMPVIQVANDRIYFPIFTGQDLCDRFCHDLAKDKIYSDAVQQAPGEYARDYFRRYRDLGASHLFINESVWVSMKDVVPPATYDGLLNQNAPLRNAELNAVLYFTMQYVRAGLQQDDMISLLWDTMQKSTFLAPIRPKSEIHAGAVLDDDNTELHIEMTKTGKKCLLIFTDPDFLEYYASFYDLKPEQYSAAYTPTFETILDYMRDKPDLSIMLNPGCGDFVFTPELLTEMETTALNVHASSDGAN